MDLMFTNIGMRIIRIFDRELLYYNKFNKVI